MTKGRTPPGPVERTIFMVTAGYGLNTRMPFVAIEVGKEKVQMSAESARELALNMLQAAEAATGDGFIVEFMIESVGLEREQATLLLRDFRAFRERTRRAEQAHDHPPTESA